MNFLKDNIEVITTIATSVLVFIAAFNEKVRGFFLNRKILNKSKAELKRDANDANDDIIETMMLRITSLSDEFTRLSDVNIETQKENYELKSKVNSLEYEKKDIKSKLSNKCKNNCLDV